MTQNSTSDKSLDSVIRELYHRLREIASRQMSREQNSHLLQTTAVVQEAWFRLASVTSRAWDSRKGFLAAAANAMKRLLIDHARQQNSLRRGGRKAREPLADIYLALDDQDFAAVDLNDALEQLGNFAPHEAQAPELMIFAGMTGEEAASVPGVSASTVDRKVRVAKAWLRSLLLGNKSGSL